VKGYNTQVAGDLILVVDDTPVNLKLTRILLLSEGYEVLTASTAEDALQLLETHRPQMILTDVQLPGIDGLELTRRVKGCERTRDILVVALTAFAMLGDEEKALQAGCDGYITKPIDTRTLGARIREYLSPDSVGAPTAAPPRPPDFEDLQQRLIAECRERLEHWLEELSGRFDAVAAAGVAHQWVGASSILGYPAISRRVSEMLSFLRERPVDNAQLRESFEDLLAALERPQ